jgi:hypothetical protein
MGAETSAPSLAPAPAHLLPLPAAAELLQAKALIALALLCRTPAGLVCVASWHGLLSQIERLCAKERQGSLAGSTEQYMAAAVSGLLQQLAGGAVPLLRKASASARAALAAAGCGSGSSSYGGALQPLEVLQLLLSSATFRPVVVCDGLITGLADLLTRELSSSSAGGPGALAIHQDVKVCGADRGVGQVSSVPAPAACCCLVWCDGAVDAILTAFPAGHGWHALMPCRCLPPCPTFPPVQAHVLNATDAVCSHPELLIEHYANVLGHLLPALSAAGTGRLAMWWGRSKERGAGWITTVGPICIQPSVAELPSCCSCQPARNARHTLLLPQASL